MGIISAGTNLALSQSATPQGLCFELLLPTTRSTNSGSWTTLKSCIVGRAGFYSTRFSFWNTFSSTYYSFFRILYNGVQVYYMEYVMAPNYSVATLPPIGFLGIGQLIQLQAYTEHTTVTAYVADFIVRAYAPTDNPFINSFVN